MAGTNALIALIRNTIPRNWNVIALREASLESRKRTGSTKPRIAPETARIIFILQIPRIALPAAWVARTKRVECFIADRARRRRKAVFRRRWQHEHVNQWVA